MDAKDPDELRLRQVLLNFLSNAIKYNNSGGEGCPGLHRHLAEGGVRFMVSDNGVGIPSDRTEERLFQPFNRLGAEHSQGQPETGIDPGIFP